eukprot:gene8982-23215_t
MESEGNQLLMAAFEHAQEVKAAEKASKMTAAGTDAPTAYTPTANPQDEIEIRSAWSSLLGSEQFDLAFQVDHIFSAAECHRLVLAAEEHGFGRTNYPHEYRGNLRLITVDPSLAAAIWHRIEHCVPAELPGHGPFGDAREYVWVPTGLNDHWRISKYHPGDQFQGHCDASFAKSDTEESKFTVNIYMNDGFDGGATRFYHGRGGGCAFTVTPETGMGCIFAQPTADRNYYHDGERQTDYSYTTAVESELGAAFGAALGELDLGIALGRGMSEFAGELGGGDGVGPNTGNGCLLPQSSSSSSVSDHDSVGPASRLLLAVCTCFRFRL